MTSHQSIPTLWKAVAGRPVGKNTATASALSIQKRNAQPGPGPTENAWVFHSKRLAVTWSIHPRHAGDRRKSPIHSAVSPQARAILE
jgi:hypothetical protein